MRYDKYFMLSWKKLGILVILWVLFVLLHNGVSAVLGVEEALFFILAIFVLPIYFIIMVIYSLVRKSRK